VSFLVTISEGSATIRDIPHEDRLGRRLRHV
jgi:hypothetical protein